jgi:hypothetical protein
VTEIGATSLAATSHSLGDIRISQGFQSVKTI